MNKKDLHPACSATPVDQKLVAQLVESIRELGQLISIVRVNGKTYDGKHRELACKQLGIPARYVDYTLPEGLSAGATAHALNTIRRHQTARERREAEIVLLKMKPHLSDREIGRATGRSHASVGKTRSTMTAGGQIDQVAGRVGSDGKTYRPKTFVPKDGKGVEIPAPLRPIFADKWLTRRVGIAEQLLRKADAELVELDRWEDESGANLYLPLDKIRESYHQVAHLMRAIKLSEQSAAPFCVCATCTGDGCSKCKQMGWLPFSG